MGRGGGEGKLCIVGGSRGGLENNVVNQTSVDATTICSFPPSPTRKGDPGRKEWFSLPGGKGINRFLHFPGQSGDLGSRVGES